MTTPYLFSSHRRMFRLSVWSTLLLQAFTPVALSLTPVMLARADITEARSHAPSLAGVATRPYVLKSGETVAQVAALYGLTTAQLKHLNQFRRFAHGFDHLKAGDELDVPVKPLSATDANKPGQGATAADNDAQQMAGYASQAGSFLANHPDGDAAAGMVKGMAVGKANQTVQEWMSQFGTAQVQLGVDDDFSLKSSSLNLLHPWYDTPQNMVFSQTGIHRTDDRTQTNLGVGYRHFRATDMIGTNLFLDYDLSRDHARTGFGGEYWRDFLKLSANAYVGLTGWKTSPDVEGYEERPASGWDLRAEGYLPVYPQLGAKVMYEQYYGNEVGLFGKDERQKNPHALTAGVNYTPFPLLTLEANRRIGKAGEHGTEFKAEVNYRIGEPLGHQLDGSAVVKLRSLAGSRYDLIDRNNDIVLEYRKQDLIRLYLPARIEGRAGQVFPLTLNVRAKHGLKNIQWDDAALLAAGGKLTGQGTQWQLTLPGWKANTVNAWNVGAVAQDTRGNNSRRADMQVVVTAPAVDAGASSLAVQDARLLADGVSTTGVTVTLKDSAGNPVTGMVDQIALTGTLTPDNSLVHGGTTLKRKAAATRATEPHLSALKERGGGVYSATLTAGTQAGKYALAAKAADTALAQATVLMEDTAADMAVSTFVTDKTTLAANGTDAATLTVTLSAKDRNGVAQPVSGEAARLSAVIGSGAAATDTDTPFSAGKFTLSDFTESGIQKGTYTATLKGTQAATLPVALHINGRDSGKTVTLTLQADAATAKVDSLSVDKTDDKPADGKSHHVYTATVTDANGNPVPDGVNVQWTLTHDAGDDGKATLSADESTTLNSKATVTLNSTRQVVKNVVVSAQTGNTAKKDAPGVNFVADEANPAEPDLKVTKDGAQVGKFDDDDTDYNTLTVTATDRYGNPLEDKKATFNLPQGVLVWKSGDAGKVQVQLDNKGEGVLHITSTTAGDFPVTVTTGAGTTKPSPSKTVTFVTDVNTAKVISVELNNKQVTQHAANGTDTFTYTATVADKDGKVLRDQPVEVFWFLEGKDIKPGYTLTEKGMTDNNGTMTATLASTAAMDKLTVGAHLGGQDNQDGAKSDTLVSFVPDLATAQVKSVTLGDQTQPLPANGKAAFTYTALVKDRNGNPVAQQGVIWNTSKDVGLPQNTTTQTDDEGHATLVLTSLLAAEDVMTSAVLTGTGKIKQDANKMVTFTADEATAHTTLTVEGSPAVADNTTSITLTFESKDENKNPLKGVQATVTLPSAVAPEGGQTKSGNNQYTVKLSDDGKQTMKVVSVNNKSGEYRDGVSVTAGIGANATATGTIIFTPAPTADAAQSVLDIVTTRQEAKIPYVTADDGTATGQDKADAEATLKLTLLTAGAEPEPVGDQAVVFEVTSGGTPETVSATETAPGTGVYQATYHHKLAGDHTVAVKVNSAYFVPNTRQTLLKVVPATPDPDQTVITYGKKEALAGDTDYVNVTFTLKDKFQNLITPDLTKVAVSSDKLPQGLLGAAVDGSGIRVTVTSNKSDTNAYIQGTITLEYDGVKEVNVTDPVLSVVPVIDGRVLDEATNMVVTPEAGSPAKVLYSPALNNQFAIIAPGTTNTRITAISGVICSANPSCTLDASASIKAGDRTSAQISTSVVWPGTELAQGIRVVAAATGPSKATTRDIQDITLKLIRGMCLSDGWRGGMAGPYVRDAEAKKTITKSEADDATAVVQAMSSYLAGRGYSWPDGVQYRPVVIWNEMPMGTIPGWSDDYLLLEAYREEHIGAWRFLILDETDVDYSLAIPAAAAACAGTW